MEEHPNPPPRNDIGVTLGKMATLTHPRQYIEAAAAMPTEEELLDRTIFVVSPAIYSKLLAMLDAPTKPNERLRRTLQAKTPWSKA